MLRRSPGWSTGRRAGEDSLLVRTSLLGRDGVALLSELSSKLNCATWGSSAHGEPPTAEFVLTPLRRSLGGNIVSSSSMAKISELSLPADDVGRGSPVGRMVGVVGDKIAGRACALLLASYGVSAGERNFGRPFRACTLLTMRCRLGGGMSRSS